jgi:hypothetical protein
MEKIQCCYSLKEVGIGDGYYYDIDIGLCTVTFDLSSRRSQSCIMNEHAISIDALFMSVAIFNRWMNGDRTPKLHGDWVNVIRSYCDIKNSRWDLSKVGFEYCWAY